MGYKSWQRDKAEKNTINYAKRRQNNYGNVTAFLFKFFFMGTAGFLCSKLQWTTVYYSVLQWTIVYYAVLFDFGYYSAKIKSVLLTVTKLFKFFFCSHKKIYFIQSKLSFFKGLQIYICNIKNVTLLKMYFLVSGTFIFVIFIWEARTENLHFGDILLCSTVSYNVL